MGDFINWLGFWLSGGSVITGLCIIGWQSFIWLKHAVWVPLPLKAALGYFYIPYPVTNWIGFQKVLDWTLDAPLSLSVIIVGGVAGSILVAWGEAMIFNRRQ